MDIISQLQEQVNSIAAMAFNSFGTLQRDAPPVRLSPNYPPPPPSSQTLAPNTNTNTNTTTNNNNNGDSIINNNNNNNGTVAAEDPADVAEQTKLMASSLVKAAKQFDALVAALPLSEGGEEAQLKRIAELQAENDVIGQELQRQLEAAEKELKQVQELFSQATDNCLNLKKPD